MTSAHPPVSPPTTPTPTAAPVLPPSGSRTPDPLPPVDLPNRTPRIVTLPKGRHVHRFHTAEDPAGNPYSPDYYDRTTSGRLNAPDGSYGVLYVADRDEGAFAESFLREPGRTLLPMDLIEQKAHARLRTTREMSFVKFYGAGQPVLGATSQVTSGPLPYDLPQAWSAAMHAAFPTVDGIAYMARHDNTELCYAVFDRARSSLAVDGQTRDLADCDRLYELMNHYQMGLSPQDV